MVMNTTIEKTNSDVLGGSPTVQHGTRPAVEETQFWDLEEIYAGIREAHRRGISPKQYFDALQVTPQIA